MERFTHVTAVKMVLLIYEGGSNMHIEFGERKLVILLKIRSSCIVPLNYKSSAHASYLCRRF